MSDDREISVHRQLLATLRSRVQADWEQDSRLNYARIASLRSMVLFEEMIALRERLGDNPHLSVLGRADALKKFVADKQSVVKDIRFNLANARAAITNFRVGLYPIDPANVAEVAKRQEIRAFLRSKSFPEVMGLIEDGADPAFYAAVMETAPMLSGLSADQREAFVTAFLNKHRPDLAEAVKKMREALDLAEAAYETLSTQMARAADFSTPEAFGEWADAA